MEILEQSFDLMFVKWVPRDKNIEETSMHNKLLYKLIIKRTGYRISYNLFLLLEAVIYFTF